MLQAQRAADSRVEGLTAFVIDDDEAVAKFVASVVKRAGFKVSAFTSSEEAIRRLPEIRPSLVVTDLVMPIADGFDVLSSSQRVDPATPVVVLTGTHDVHVAVEAMKRGATDYVCKPVEPERLTVAILAARSSLESSPAAMTERAEFASTISGLDLQITDLRQRLETSTVETLQALIAALDVRERETNKHSLRVSAYATYLAAQMGISGADLVAIQRGSLLHDIGKIGIPDSILLKPGPLNDEEWKVMRTHPLLGHQIVQGLGWLRGGEQIILHHHERFDGGGYPSGFSGLAIPFGARLFAVIDTFDALTTDRPYRRARSFEEGIKEICRCNGTQFDPSIVSAFLAVPQEVWEEKAAEARNLKIALACA